MPYPAFFGTWGFRKGMEADPDLLRLAQHLEDETWPVRISVDAFKKELAAGLYFRSTIPVGYGLGSSGAVVAGVFDRYSQGQTLEDLNALRSILGKMESCFHGKSSGLDPLVCYQQQALLLQGKGSFSPAEVPTGEANGKGALFSLRHGASATNRTLGPSL